ncbi:hypothetical protein [Amycolatopsis minnesotensis]
MTAESVPAWQRRTEGESRWQAMAVVTGTLASQLALPGALVLSPRWLLPALSTLLIVALLLVNPGKVDRRSRRERLISLVLVALVSAANALSAIELVIGIVDGSITGSAGRVLLSGVIVYWTNIVVFSLWYWEFDRGGPAARALGEADYPDFMFPQMSDPKLAPPDWEPGYLDYLYVSFTNAAAFSPTDVMPLRRWAKLTMLAQAGLSLILALMVVAWAVGGLRG